ncbi:MAG TPA: protein kinase, partial [Polyangiaceae bacterium]|nr:protein kinase [Polyangiaceae bacterium]
RWLLDVRAGLGTLHRSIGFVHGEVQPEHLVLGDDGVGRLIPVVRAHWARGEERAPERLYYLAPEKLLGDEVSPRSDVFSVGVMLWEALAGQRLMAATTPEDIITRLMSGIPRGRAPEGEAWTLPLTDIAERAMLVDPGQRFASAAELKEALEKACAGHLARTPGMAELFADPERGARSSAPDSMPPYSQRITLPPADPDPNLLDAAAERLSRLSFHDLDATDESAAPAASAALAPDERPARHAATLLGLSPPQNQPRSVAPAPLPEPRPRAAVASERPRGPSLSPLVAARLPQVGETESSGPARPRKRHAAVWLVVVAAAAAGVFAARPWLIQRITAATRTPDADAAHDAFVALPTAAATPSVSSSSAAAEPSSIPAPLVGSAASASEPSDAALLKPALAQPADKDSALRHGLEPKASTPVPPTPASAPHLDKRPEATPQLTPPPAEAVPARPAAPKPAPASDATRYGI